MKLIWDMYMTAEYIHRKFKKGDGWCRCEKAKETSTHMLHECQSEANALGREQLVYKIHRSIRKLVEIKAVSPNWGWFLTQMFALDKDGATMMWDPGSIPDWALWVQTQRMLMERPLPTPPSDNPAQHWDASKNSRCME